MGNCIGSLFQSPAEKTAHLVQGDGGEEECRGSGEKNKSGRDQGHKLVGRSFSFASLLSNTEINFGEIDQYLLLPPPARHHGLIVPSKLENKESGRRQKVKITLTRQQLELLLRNAEELQAEGIILGSGISQSFRGKNQRWHPALATIPELQEF